MEGKSKAKVATGKELVEFRRAWEYGTVNFIDK
jgi:hypothetical protein